MFPSARTWAFHRWRPSPSSATAGVLGDAGAPASDTILGSTMGFNADGQHNHIKDSVIPTFIHYNIPLLVAGWIAALVL